MQDFSAEFLDEAAEKLEAFQVVIFALERSGTAPRLLDEAFRNIHTIKGSGHSVGFVALAEAVHHLENRLDLLRREPDRPLAPAEVDNLLAWGDFIESYLAGLRLDRAYYLDPRDVIDAMRALDGPVPGEARQRRDDGGAHEGKDAGLAARRQAPPGPASDGEGGGAPPAARPPGLESFPIFYRSYIAGSRSPTAETAWSLLSLAVLGLPTTSLAKFAAVALEVLRAHCEVEDIHRICLVRRLGLSNQYEVLSSASVGEQNPLPSGSRCFVNPSGSLSKIMPGTLRVLNIPQAMASFTREDRQPQRALRRLAAGGYRSGICIALGANGSCEGLLFVNAATDFFLDMPAAKLPYISSLATHATGRLRHAVNADPLYFQVFGRHKDAVCGRPFELTELRRTTDLIGRVVGMPPTAYRMPANLPPQIIVSHGNLGFLIAKLSSHRVVTACDVAVTSDGAALHAECRLDVGGAADLLTPDRLETSARCAEALGIREVVVGPTLVRFEIPVERSWGGNASYSV